MMAWMMHIVKWQKTHELRQTVQKGSVESDLQTVDVESPVDQAKPALVTQSEPRMFVRTPCPDRQTNTNVLTSHPSRDIPKHERIVLAKNFTQPPRLELASQILQGTEGSIVASI